MEFTNRLLNWYHENKRVLPFRSSNDPYHIWISEIMAQQTQIATMIPYYERWILKYPTIKDLAEGQIEDILKMWEGLGYYNRARNLHKGAQYVMDNFGGELPKDKKLLMEIPGIGDYTSSAIAAIAFNLPEIAVDGNVKRVMSRYLNYTENANTRLAHKTFEDFLKNELIKSGANPADFVQALMELGALVYTPSNTNCENSPFKEMCACYRGENVGTIPFFPKAKKVPVYDKTVLYYINEGFILLSKDDEDGLMKDFYRLPQIDGHSDKEPLTTLVHKFTHLHWNIQVDILTDLPENEHWFLFPIKELDTISMVTAHRKILNKLKY
ncbi:MAG: A/G-specific adenine glycosylase [Erysipelothrix sp.]|nr:A/G-specific adenine glycosylase [Erysipelothrix sp.]